ncbi:MAG TPA: hypothetical protein VIJ79_01475 [Acidobacteriaceae bacterium]
MKSIKAFLWLAGGICAATAGLMIWNHRCSDPVEDLAHRLESAWSDHHTVA